MSTSPEECRARSRRCAEVAAETKDQKLKKTFTELAQEWAGLADEVERAQALRDDLSLKRKI
jgi:hypothetical protein